jgi:hypothetical protein
MEVPFGPLDPNRCLQGVKVTSVRRLEENRGPIPRLLKDDEFIRAVDQLGKVRGFYGSAAIMKGVRLLPITVASGAAGDLKCTRVIPRLAQDNDNRNDQHDGNQEKNRSLHSLPID